MLILCVGKRDCSVTLSCIKIRMVESYSFIDDSVFKNISQLYLYQATRENETTNVFQVILEGKTHGFTCIRMYLVTVCQRQNSGQYPTRYNRNEEHHSINSLWFSAVAKWPIVRVYTLPGGFREN